MNDEAFSWNEGAKRLDRKAFLQDGGDQKVDHDAFSWNEGVKSLETGAGLKDFNCAHCLLVSMEEEPGVYPNL